VPARGHFNFALQVFRVNQLLAKSLDDALAASGLDSGDFAVLSVLRLVQPIRSTELAEILRMRPTSLSTRLAALQRRRLVRRRRDEVDGRARLVELTRLGDRKVQSSVPSFAAFIASFEERLGGRLGDVQDALADLEHALEAPKDDSTSRGARRPRSAQLER
jgi:DNA-binding MarR family transcriptional regulator